MKIFWACPYSILDPTHGAMVAMHELLRQLSMRGIAIESLGATNFGSPKGAAWLSSDRKPNSVIAVQDGSLVHRLVATRRFARGEMTSAEEDFFLSLYMDVLDKSRPDIVLTFGGHCLDYCIREEARKRNIPVVFYLVNERYGTERTFRNVSLVVTNTEAMCGYYKKKLDVDVAAFGSPINFEAVRASGHDRKNVLFVNPAREKGVAFVVALIHHFAKKHPELTFEIVESVCEFAPAFAEFSAKMGLRGDLTSNVRLTPLSPDMKPIYQRARLILVPSLWFECFGRVLAEAMINGVPGLVTNRGGLPEVLGNAGAALNFPDEYYEAPYDKAFTDAQAAPAAAFIEKCYSDGKFYEKLSKAAVKKAEKYEAGKVAERFLAVLAEKLSIKK